ncbi:hypothetical protein GCM10020001_025740 [Nonomuraea salmonea]
MPATISETPETIAQTATTKSSAIEVMPGQASATRPATMPMIPEKISQARDCAPVAEPGEQCEKDR